MRRVPVWVGLIVCVAVVGVAIVVLQAQGQRQAADATRAAGSSCSPAPCADADGYRMHVDRTWRRGGLLHVQVSFSVHGRSNMHAAPEDFSLRDSGGHGEAPSFQPGAGCPRWPRTNIPEGGRLGPETLCFHTGNPRPTLHWAPDTGITEYFSPGYDVAI